MLNLCGIVVAILKMVTARNFSMPVNGLVFLRIIVKIGKEPVSDMSLEDGVNLMRGKPGTDIEITIMRKNTKPFTGIEKFLAVTIFKMATTIPHKFNIVRFQQHFISE
jgi:hypothetical protein